MSFTVQNGYFVKNNTPTFVVSGEIHYFRLNPKDWEKHLRLLKQSGATTTSTYIPWAWHEFEENVFDFYGKTNPARNLVGYIELCKKIGLQLIVKPGPYILAEYELQGLPEWLIHRSSKNAFALDEHGNIIGKDLMSYMSDEFLNYAFHWYDNVMPIIERYQEKNGGPIVMMQVCNEVGVFQWLSGKIDYNDSVKILFQNFLQEKYQSIQALNTTYNTRYRSFQELSAPHGIIKNQSDYSLYYDFHLFYRDYYAQYLDILSKKIKSFGIDVVLTHNIPGWIYGNAAELPMLISTYEKIMRTRKDIIFGLDHIPEFFSFRNAHSDLACNKILEAMQPHGPVWAAEFQAGTREHHVRCDANDMEAFYIASLAHGLKSFNYYMFSQGINPKGKGYYGKTFYYQTPLDAKGNKSQLYSVTKRIGNFIRKEHDEIIISKTNAKIAVGLYKPYFYTELTTSQMLKEKRLFVEKLGLQYDPRFLREEVLFNGLLRGLQTLNFNYDIKDLELTSVKELLKYKQLWIVSAEFMDEQTQKVLAEYVKQGGHLILYPTVPVFDNYLHPCTVLKNELQLQYSSSESDNKVQAFGIEDIYTFFAKKIIFANNGNAVAHTRDGNVCGIQKQIEAGSVTFLGFAFGYTADEHLQLIEKIVALDTIKRDVKVSDPDIQFVKRFGKKFSYLFLLNYHNTKKTFTVNSKKIILNPFSGKIIKSKL